MTHQLVCLLPARNAAHDLPGFFDSVRGLCDAVVALDDGSTDATPELLAAEPLVRVRLSNPRRADYRGWDDAANRNRLLEAAAEIEPEWILSLDADERIDPSDAVALRAFLATDALPGCAYGFRHVPMRGDGEHFLPRFQWVYRLFAYAPGQRFPSQRLHFIPVPAAIPRARWLKTTLRIQHLGGMTTDRRFSRFAKYLEADPQRTYQADYTHLLAEPAEGALRRWQPRAPGLPVLLDANSDDDDLDRDTPTGDGANEPVISAIVIARNDEATIARSVAAVVNQQCPEPFEVIVVVSGSDRTAAIVRDQFPTVTLIALDRPALPGDARNAGLRVARGRYVTFPGSHIELPPGSLAARVAAHRRGYALVTGVTFNGNESRAGWASYFLDHHTNLPGHHATELSGPPAYCSYARLPLLEVGGFPEGVRSGEDTAANRALVRRGYVAFRDPSVTMIHGSPCRSVGKLVRHHFTRGRGWGRLLLDDYRATGNLLRSDAIKHRGPNHFRRRLASIQKNVRSADEALAKHYDSVRRLIVLGALASWLGMWWEILRPAHGKPAVLLGSPTRTLALAGIDSKNIDIAIARVGPGNRGIRVMHLPSDLKIAADGQHPVPLDNALRTIIGGDAAGVRSQLAALISTVTQIDIDDHLVARADTLGRIRSLTQRGAGCEPEPKDPGRRDRGRFRAFTSGWRTAIRIRLAVVIGAAHTSLSIPALATLTRQASAPGNIKTIAVEKATESAFHVRERPSREGLGTAAPLSATPTAEPTNTPKPRRPWMA